MIDPKDDIHAADFHAFGNRRHGFDLDVGGGYIGQPLPGRAKSHGAEPFEQMAVGPLHIHAAYHRVSDAPKDEVPIGRLPVCL